MSARTPEKSDNKWAEFTDPDSLDTIRFLREFHPDATDEEIIEKVKEYPEP